MPLTSCGVYCPVSFTAYCLRSDYVNVGGTHVAPHWVLHYSRPGNAVSFRVEEHMFQVTHFTSHTLLLVYTIPALLHEREFRIMQHNNVELAFSDTFKFHVSRTDGKTAVRINLLFYLFFTVVPSKTCIFLSCRPFVVITTFSTVLVGVEVSSVSWLGQLTVGV